MRRYFYVIRRGHVRAGTKARSRLLERLQAVAARGDEHECVPRLPRTRGLAVRSVGRAVTRVTDGLSW